MPFYKYCSSDVVDRVAAGSLRFASLAWFRHLEEDDGNCAIGDRLEGRAETRLDGFSAQSELSKPDRATIERMGIRIKNLKGEVRIDSTVRSHDCGHWLVFCVSSSTRPDLGSSDYSACVEIADLDALGALIWKSGKIGKFPVSTFFDLIEVRRVEYLAREGDARHVEARLAGSAFLKRKRYAAQQEFRIAMRARNPSLPDVQIVQVSAPPELLRVHEIGASGQKATDQRQTAAPTRQSIARDLSQLLLELRDFPDAPMFRPPRQAEFEGDMEAFEAQLKRRWEEHLRLSADARNALVKKFRQPVMSSYWRARILGVRGPWERGFEFWRSAGQIRGGMEELIAALDPNAANSEMRLRV